MIELINIKTAIRNLVLSLVFSIILPVFVFGFIFLAIDPLGVIFSTDLILLNGILFTIIYTAFGLFRKETAIRFFMGIGYIVILVYFFSVGNNVFTMYLPHCSFATFCVSGDIILISLDFRFGYFWLVVLYLIAKFLNLLRHKIKPIDEDLDIIEF